ncbi:MAG: L-threonylcarbamoyladenylate synthase [Paracoccaceae bacterium]
MTTERLSPDDAGLDRAAALLRDGQLVAFPTETVYGLGADATDDHAVAGIFDAKRRPHFNPLIVHVPTLTAAARIGDIPEAADAFLQAGWPPGLTLVVPLCPDAGIAPLTTAGQPTVALRVPAAPIARALLTRVDRPVAAPSANPSGRISPTSADHVIAGLAGRIAAVVDGGPTQDGVESTILAFDDDGPMVLREGAYLVPDTVRRQTKPTDDTAPLAPGMLTSHYAPKGQLRMNAKTLDPGEWGIGFGPDTDWQASLSATGDLREAAARLFALLHEADDKDRIAVAPVPDTGLGRAINDRLRRAAAPRTA